MTSTTIYSDVVLPAATWYEKHDLNTTDMHPFVHSFNPAIARRGRPAPTGTRSWPSPRRSAAWPPPIWAPAPTSSPRRCCTTPPTNWPTRTGGCADWKTGECEPIPGRTMPKLVAVRAGLRRDRRQDGRARPAAGHAGRHHEGRHVPGRAARSSTSSTRTAPCAAASPTAARRSPATCRPARRSWPCPAPPTGTWPPRASTPSRRQTGVHAGRPGRRARGQADHLRRHPGAPGTGDHLTGVVRFGGRRAALLAVRHQRRTAQALAHPDRPADASTSTTTGWPNSASGCRPTGRR